MHSKKGVKTAKAGLLFLALKLRCRQVFSPSAAQVHLTIRNRISNADSGLIPTITFLLSPFFMQLLSVILLIIGHSFTERYPKENPLTKSKNVVESFVEKVFKIQLQMSGADLKKVNFSTSDLYKNPGKFSRIEFYKNVEPIDSSIAWKMEYSEGVITISKMDEESGCGIRIFLLEDRIYFSVFNFASRFTEQINLKAGKVMPLKYYVKSVNKAIATIGDDYTDPRGVDHPQYQGHIWREARLNIRTNKISRWRILDY